MGRYPAVANELGEITVSEPAELTVGGRSRATATVLGEELWFESEQATMSANPELFATALLPIAAGAGARLILDSPLDPVWTRNAAGILPVWDEWWGYEPRLDRMIEAPAAALDRAPRRAEAGLCFTLGVDSFHSLLRSEHRVDLLIFGLGYDVPLGDGPRLEAIQSSLRAVCEAIGCAAAVVRTNLREHTVGRHMDWERGHGGPVAALGHACSGRIGELLVSASFPYFDAAPWGSHFRTDAGWSSSRLRVTHLGAEQRRAMKLAALVDEEVVQRHLRVCWENRATTGNCGECEKCVRTMLVLSAHGARERFPVFPDGPMLARVNAIEAVSPAVIEVYETLHGQLAERRLRRAVSRLIARSDPQAATGSRLRFVRRGFGAGSDGSTSPRRKRPV
jgi:hypothetical protein